MKHINDCIDAFNSRPLLQARIKSLDAAVWVTCTNEMNSRTILL